MEEQGYVRGFGHMLRALRESYAERTMVRSGAPAPRMRLSALTLIKCLSDAGYSISSGSYSEIEAGTSLPRDTRRFLEAVRACLVLTDAQYHELVQQLGFDIVKAKMGVELARLVFPTAHND